MASWNMQEYWDFDIFWLCDGRICEGVSPLCVFAPRIQTCHFSYCTHERHFLRRIFEANVKSGNYKSRKVTRVSWNPHIPLLHPNIYTSLSTFVLEQGKYSEETKNALKAAWQPRSVGGLKL